jgi:hypothetical protein
MQQLLPKKSLSSDHVIYEKNFFIIINLSISFSINEAVLVDILHIPSINPPMPSQSPFTLLMFIVIYVVTWAINPSSSS